ncbi:Protein of unknown function UPF0568 family-containing protein [Strongyloides ratti]|uniref:Uncharacterized protein n=1 Tax=Strongyloides ratti TaxID=34506 RepID=A0A090L5K8_STRRB|nr:Protein of unknown function UPF0568 family-containing protein [Strongyloides ratti]CEF65012.1 Protein of unknown function UPF0568 family-containing protein [Strongyloides ratti]
MSSGKSRTHLLQLSSSESSDVGTGREIDFIPKLDGNLEESQDVGTAREIKPSHKVPLADISNDPTSDVETAREVSQGPHSMPKDNLNISGLNQALGTLNIQGLPQASSSAPTENPQVITPTEQVPAIVSNEKNQSNEISLTTSSAQEQPSNVVPVSTEVQPVSTGTPQIVSSSAVETANVANQPQQIAAPAINETSQPNPSVQEVPQVQPTATEVQQTPVAAPGVSETPSTPQPVPPSSVETLPSANVTLTTENVNEEKPKIIEEEKPKSDVNDKLCENKLKSNDVASLNSSSTDVVQPKVVESGTEKAAPLLVHIAPSETACGKKDEVKEEASKGVNIIPVKDSIPEKVKVDEPKDTTHNAVKETATLNPSEHKITKPETPVITKTQVEVKNEDTKVNSLPNKVEQKVSAKEAEKPKVEATKSQPKKEIQPEKQSSGCYDEKIVASELESLAQNLGLPKGSTQEETISILYFYIKNAESKGYLKNIIQKPKKNDRVTVMSIDEVPLGMKTSGNKKIDTLAKIVRLKYLEQFRDIQEYVNQRINKAQIMTADPKTNMSLAKVGF